MGLRASWAEAGAELNGSILDSLMDSPSGQTLQDSLGWHYGLVAVGFPAGQSDCIDSWEVDANRADEEGVSGRSAAAASDSPVAEAEAADRPSFDIHSGWNWLVVGRRGHDFGNYPNQYCSQTEDMGCSSSEEVEMGWVVDKRLVERAAASEVETLRWKVWAARPWLHVSSVAMNGKYDLTGSGGLTTCTLCCAGYA